MIAVGEAEFKRTRTPEGSKPFDTAIDTDRDRLQAGT